MRVGISNLAWTREHDAAVADRLQHHAVDVIDIAPGRYFDDPTRARPAEVIAVRKQWAARGIAVFGLQALLFGSTGLNVFGDGAARAALLARLAAVFRIGADLGAQVAVFGSPRQRDRSGLDDGDAQRSATEVFRRAGDLAAEQGITLCLEPNPPRYGCNFMTTAAETTAIVRAVDHPAVRLQCDLGALHLSGDDLIAGLDDWGSLVGHVHLSEPDLRVLGSAGTPHAKWAPVVAQRLPQHIACIEMLAADGHDPLPAVDAALALATRLYRSPASP